MPGLTRKILILGLVTGACGEKLDESDTSQGALTSEASGDPPTTSVPTGTDGESSSSGSTSGDAPTSTGAPETTSTGETSTGETSVGETSTGEPVECGAPEFSDASLPPIALADCADIQAETRWCLVFGDDSSVRALGLDSQTSCKVVDVEMGVIVEEGTTSMGVVGEHLYTCSTVQGNGLVVRVSLVDGVVETSMVPCINVTTWRGHPVVMSPDEATVVDIFMDWSAVMEGAPSWQLPPLWDHVEMLASQGDVLYGAWHSDDHFSRFMMPCGEPLDSVVLEGFNDAMEGIAISEDLRYITYGFTYPGLRSFDAVTGAVAEDWPDVTPDGAGLLCFVQ